jgi:hypothetical protein
MSHKFQMLLTKDAKQNKHEAFGTDAVSLDFMELLFSLLRNRDEE